MNDKTTITVQRNVHDRLLKFGHFGETWSDVIGRLLDEVEKTNEK
jgi:predicted CopG family antitoxin